MPKCSGGCIIEGMKILKNYMFSKSVRKIAIKERKAHQISMQKAVEDAKFAIEATKPLSMQSKKSVEEAIESLMSVQAARIYKK